MNTVTHLLDTSVYCQPLKPHPSQSVVQHWKRVGDHRIGISVICEAELRYGLENRNSDRLWQVYHSSLKHRLKIYSVDGAVAQKFAELKAVVEKQGLPRADFDLLIAATALQNNLILVSHNTRHFQTIPNLKLENWFEEF